MLCITEDGDSEIMKRDPDRGRGCYAVFDRNAVPCQEAVLQVTDFLLKVLLYAFKLLQDCHCLFNKNYIIISTKAQERAVSVAVYISGELRNGKSILRDKRYSLL